MAIDDNSIGRCQVMSTFMTDQLRAACSWRQEPVHVLIKLAIWVSGAATTVQDHEGQPFQARLLALRSLQLQSRQRRASAPNRCGPIREKGEYGGILVLWKLLI